MEPWIHSLWFIAFIAGEPLVSATVEHWSTMRDETFKKVKLIQASAAFCDQSCRWIGHDCLTLRLFNFPCNISKPLAWSFPFQDSQSRRWKALQSSLCLLPNVDILRCNPCFSAPLHATGRFWTEAIPNAPQQPAALVFRHGILVKLNTGGQHEWKCKGTAMLAMPKQTEYWSEDLQQYGGQNGLCR